MACGKLPIPNVLESENRWPLLTTHGSQVYHARGVCELVPIEQWLDRSECFGFRNVSCFRRWSRCRCIKGYTRKSIMNIPIFKSIPAGLRKDIRCLLSRVHWPYRLGHPHYLHTSEPNHGKTWRWTKDGRAWFCVWCGRSRTVALQNGLNILVC